jgi:hypothetical protein
LDAKLKSNGFTPLKSNRAIDFKKYGYASFPHVGALVVERNHVSVMIGYCEDGSIKAISGNHANRVNIGCYSRSKILAFRRI